MGKATAAYDCLDERNRCIRIANRLHPHRAASISYSIFSRFSSCKKHGTCTTCMAATTDGIHIDNLPPNHLPTHTPLSHEETHAGEAAKKARGEGESDGGGSGDGDSDGPPQQPAAAAAAAVVTVDLDASFEFYQEGAPDHPETTPARNERYLAEDAATAKAAAAANAATGGGGGGGAARGGAALYDGVDKALRDIRSSSYQIAWYDDDPPSVTIQDATAISDVNSLISGPALKYYAALLHKNRAQSSAQGREEVELDFLKRSANEDGELLFFLLARALFSSQKKCCVSAHPAPYGERVLLSFFDLLNPTSLPTPSPSPFCRER